jgi:hypothetical protein
MSENKPPALPKALSGQLLPPVSDGPNLPTAPLGLGFIVRAANASERKQLESYSRLAAAKHELLRLTAQQYDLITALRHAKLVSAVQLEHLPQIREIEALRITNQLNAFRRDSDLENLRKEVEVEGLQVQLAELRRRRKEIENPAAPPPPPPSKPTLAEQLTSELDTIRSIDNLLMAQRQAVIDAAGGEGALTEEHRQELERIEILRRTHIEKLYEDMI